MSISQGDKNRNTSTKRWFVGTELLRRGWTKHDAIEYVVSSNGRAPALPPSLKSIRRGTILGIHDNGDGDIGSWSSIPKIIIKDVEGGFESCVLREIRVLLPPSDEPNTFEVGDVIDCRDQRGKWRAAEVKTVKPAFEGNENEGILVHFKGLGADQDALWIEIDKYALCKCMDLCVRKYHRVCREVYYQSQSILSGRAMHQKWIELESEDGVPVRSALRFEQSIWISSDRGTMYEFDCQNDTLGRLISNRGFYSPSICRAGGRGEGCIIMADPKQIQSFNVHGDGIGPAHLLPGGPFRGDRARIASLLKIGDHIHIRREFGRDLSEGARCRDLVIPLNDILSPSSPSPDDPIRWIQPIDREAQIDRERDTMDGEIEIVMEDDELGTRLFKFGGVENKATHKFYIGALQDKEWVQRNICQPLEDAFDALARNGGTEHASNTWIIDIIVDYFHFNKFAIAWHEAPHWTLKRPLSFCGVVQTDSHIVVFGGEDSNELSDEIYILDTRSNEGWVQSPIKCPTKSRYVAVLDHRQRVHIFTSQSPSLHVDPKDKLRLLSAHPDDVYIQGHYCIALEHLLPQRDHVNIFEISM